MQPRDGTIVIRVTRPSDIEAIVRLTSREFRAASIDARIQSMIGGARWIKVKASVLRNEVTANPRGCFVATRGAEVVGYVTTTVNPAASRGTIANLAVSSICQGRGIGRRLLRRALRHFRKLGLHHAKIETLETNAVGRHLYPSLGFREVARQIHYVLPLDNPPLKGRKK